MKSYTRFKSFPNFTVRNFIVFSVIVSSIYARRNCNYVRQQAPVASTDCSYEIKKSIYEFKLSCSNEKYEIERDCEVKFNNLQDRTDQIEHALSYSNQMRDYYILERQKG